MITKSTTTGLGLGGARSGAGVSSDFGSVGDEPGGFDAGTMIVPRPRVTTSTHGSRLTSTWFGFRGAMTQFGSSVRTSMPTIGRRRRASRPDPHRGIIGETEVRWD